MITFNRVNEILKTLPIGYYLGTSIDCILEQSDVSYHDPVENKIAIGFNSLPLDNVNENDPELEDNIRCMLYHEVSHALLTPDKMKMTDELNIFEDQRIETVLKDFYHRVDFESFVKKVNGYTGPEAPKSADEYYYQIVRYGEGPEKFINWRDHLIVRYGKINHNFEPWQTYNYERDVEAFYKAVCDDFNQQQQQQQQQEQQTPDGNDDNKNQTQKQNRPQPQPQTQQPQQSKQTRPANSQPQIIPPTQLEKDMIIKAVEELVKKMVTRHTTSNIKSQVKAIIENARRKKGMQAGAIKTYSGKLNPKLINRPGKVETYKWWEKSNQNSDSNRFSKIQLNLFCDVSESFAASEHALNDLIAALIEIEKSNKDFKVNVVKIGDKVRIEKDRRIQCNEGSCLDTNVINIYRSLQTPNTNLYNLVVFDGDIQQGFRPSMKPMVEKAFTAFNHTNCIVISDPDNKRNLDKYAPNSKRIYINSNYESKFEKNVLAALRLLVR